MSVEYIRAKFRIKTTPNIIGDPTYKAINDTRDVLCANAAAVPMTLGGRGGGRNGHIGLIMDAAVYKNLYKSGYTRPAEPGTYAQHGSGNTEAAQSDTNSYTRRRGGSMI